jgi:hypothetical protein
LAGEGVSGMLSEEVFSGCDITWIGKSRRLGMERVEEG